MFDPIQAQRTSARRWLILLAVAGIYFTASRLGFALGVMFPQVTAVWPPTGIALAAILIYGFEVWPAIAVAALATNLMRPQPVSVACVIAIGNTLEALAGAYLLRKSSFQNALTRIHDVFYFVIYGAAVSTLISASIGATALCAVGVYRWSEFNALWSTWWIGDMLGDLIVGTLILSWICGPRQTHTLKLVLEGACFYVMLAAVSFALLSGQFIQTESGQHLSYVLFPFTIWAGLRFSQRDIPISILLVSFIAIFGITRPSEPNSVEGVHESLMLMQAFLAVLTVTGLAIAAANAERRAAAAELDKHNQRVQADIGARLEEEKSARLEAEANEQRTAFLVEAHDVLSSSLEFEKTLAKVAAAAIPRFADICSINLHNEKRALQRVGVAAADPKILERIREIDQLYPQGSENRYGAQSVLRSGKSEWVAQVTPGMLTESAQDEEHLRRLREFRFNSYICVPLKAREKILGTLTFIFSESGRRYSEVDLRIGEELGRRIAIAVDNARLYREAQESRKSAEAANRAKDEFLATLSHELRTPLTPMMGWTRMIRSGRLDAETSARGLEAIERNVKSQARLIEDLLDVSRVITGKLRLDIREVGIIPIIEAAIDAVKPAADAKGIHFNRTFDANPPALAGDPARLQQIFWNLLANSVKFTQRAGSIRVLLENRDTHIAVCVSDSGEGISAEFLPHVFDRFRQADSTTTRVHGGLGLGLAIVRHLVEMHGGTVQAASDGKGKGASFTVTLPIATQRAAKLYSSGYINARKLGGSSLKGLRIMVVDDEADTRELLTMCLEQYGADVMVAASAAEAFDKLQDEKPDLLISDIGMPGEDGFSLIQRIRSQSKNDTAGIPAIALTAYAREEDRSRALDCGFQIHLAKPVEPNELATAIMDLTRENAQKSGELKP